MKLKIMLIGIMLVLALCISPVAAVSGTDFEVVAMEDSNYDVYAYRNVINPVEKYTSIYSSGTHWLNSYVTIKPANIPDAPVMVVHSVYVPLFHHQKHILLPRSVDEWEIKYYSSCSHKTSIDDKYLKNAGVVNLNEFFGEHIKDGLNLELSTGQYIYPMYRLDLKYTIPSV